MLNLGVDDEGRGGGGGVFHIQSTLPKSNLLGLNFDLEKIRLMRG